jgi:hypothetical protein
LCSSSLWLTREFHDDDGNDIRYYISPPFLRHFSAFICQYCKKKKNFTKGMKRKREEPKPTPPPTGSSDLYDIYVEVAKKMNIKPTTNFGVRYNHEDRNLCIVQYFK